MRATALICKVSHHTAHGEFLFAKIKVWQLAVSHVAKQQLMNSINVISGMDFSLSEPHTQRERDAVVVVLDICTDIGLIAIIVVDG